MVFLALSRGCPIPGHPDGEDAAKVVLVSLLWTQAGFQLRFDRQGNKGTMTSGPHRNKSLRAYTDRHGGLCYCYEGFTS